MVSEMMAAGQNKRRNPDGKWRKGVDRHTVSLSRCCAIHGGHKQAKLLLSIHLVSGGSHWNLCSWAVLLPIPPLALNGAICGRVLPQLMQVRPLACAETPSLAGLGAEAELVPRDRDSPCCCQAGREPEPGTQAALRHLS